MQNNIFIRIQDETGQTHYVNPLHIIDLYDVTSSPVSSLPHCQVYLTHSKSFVTNEPAISIIERIYSHYGQITNSYINTK